MYYKLEWNQGFFESWNWTDIVNHPMYSIAVCYHWEKGIGWIE